MGNYHSAYNIEFEKRRAKNGHALAHLLADFLIDDLECQEDYETPEVTMVECPVEILCALPIVI